jgi:hypothetical protein
MAVPNSDNYPLLNLAGMPCKTNDLLVKVRPRELGSFNINFFCRALLADIVHPSAPAIMSIFSQEKFLVVIPAHNGWSCHI